MFDSPLDVQENYKSVKIYMMVKDGTVSVRVVSVMQTVKWCAEILVAQ